MRLDFPRHGAQLLLVEPLAHGEGGTPQSDLPTFDLDLDGEWRSELGSDDDMNCLRFHRFRFTTTDPDDADGLQRASAALARAGAPSSKPKPMINVLQGSCTLDEAWPVELAMRQSSGLRRGSI